MGCPNMTGVKEEDLAFFAPRALDNFYQYYHPKLLEVLGLDTEANNMTRMMTVLPYVAEHFGLDKNDILRNWTADFGLMRMRNET